jgi:GTPase SAR1 family protein
MRRKRKSTKTFKINDYLVLKLQNGKTNIYIRGRRIYLCINLLLNVSNQNINGLSNITSLDEAAGRALSTEKINVDNYKITPETEFWGHCSNLQAWYENNYNTEILHRDIAFPLLKKLTEAGEHIAKKVFKEEIINRIESGHPSIVNYLINHGYLNYFKRKEIKSLYENTAFVESIIENATNLRELPKWLFKKLKIFRPSKNIEPKYVSSIENEQKPYEYESLFKIFLIGKSGFLKDLFSNTCYNNFSEDYHLTIGINFGTKTIDLDEYKIKLLIWDYNCEERFKYLLKSYLNGSRGAIFLCDLTKPNSILQTIRYLRSIRRQYDRVLAFPKLLVGLKTKLNNEHQIPEMIKYNAAMMNGFNDYIECAPETGWNVDEVFMSMSKLIIQRMSH